MNDQTQMAGFLNVETCHLYIRHHAFGDETAIG